MVRRAGLLLRGSAAPLLVGILALGLAVVLVLWPERSAHADRPTAARLSSDEPTGFAVVAHRGYPGRGVTENTVPAFRRAVAAGATAIELDVQLTRDGRLLVLHDATLRRTTTCRGRVENRTLARIQTRCRGQRGHELVPSLGQVLDLVARLGTHVVIDLKRHPRHWSPARYARLVEEITSRGLEERTVVLGFHRANLEAVRALEPSLRVQAIARDEAAVAAYRRWADGLNLAASLATPELVADLRAQGLLVLGRKTGQVTDWSQLRGAGADGVLTSRVAPYVSWASLVPTPTEPTPDPTPTPVS